MRYLRGIRPLTAILDNPAAPFSHAKLMRETIAENAPLWRRLSSHEGPRGPIEVWRLE
jgi:hypothetical protein